MSHILAEVLHAKENATIDELNETLKNLSSKIAQLKTMVIQSLHSTFVLHDTDLARVVQWHTEIQDIQDELIELEEQLGQDNQLLQSAHEDFETISFELSECLESIQVLKTLIEVVKHLEVTDPQDVYNASIHLKTSETMLSSVIKFFPSAADHIWIKQLRARLSDMAVDVYENCQQKWRSTFRFEKNCLNIRPAIPTVQLMDSLKNINSFLRVWEKFMTMIWLELFKPACSKHYKIDVYPKTSTGKMNRADHESSFTVIKSEVEDTDLYSSGVIIRAIKLESPNDSAIELFRNITELVEAFHKLFRDTDQEMGYFVENIAPKINNELSNNYLKTLILQKCEGDIEKARADGVIMQQFVKHLEANLAFTFPPESVFDDISKNFDNLFLSQVRQALIVKIRDLIIVADVHDTEEVIFESTPNSALTVEELALLRKNPNLFPRCVLSKSVVQIVSLLKNFMKRYPNDVRLWAACISLYISLVKIPKHESDSGELVPLTSVLIHNNSLYLAHHASFTFPMVDDMVPDLRSKASQAVAFMMRCVRSKLNELISTAMSSIEERVARNIDITHDFLVITAELKRLNNIMSGVLPPLGWQDILATLVDHTVGEICTKILAWDDIPANVASELATAFTQLAVTTSNLFKGDASTPREVEALTTRAVKKWQRFRLIIFVLTASMKEIESKWVGGCGPLANEFTAEEIRRLVRALFQNTDRRAAFLATIK